jgi:predicted nuclease of predicted toxin-antitoxin system
MPRLLFDANIPRGLQGVLSDHEVFTAFQMGWGALVNGDLLAAAEAAGFDAMITGDKNLAYQQNLTGRKLAIIVLSTNHWPTIRSQQELVMEAVKAITPSSYTEVVLNTPALRRRPFNP